MSVACDDLDHWHGLAAPSPPTPLPLRRGRGEKKRPHLCGGGEGRKITDHPVLLMVARVLLAALVAGLLILAHGCHGDEDNELFDIASILHQANLSPGTP